ncbi:hypothetical protein [Actinomadura verrucosospora]|uniref:Uncharacterized protein n=1 Tax=Actinomadura verrucosospora TaxID=46165 RepID=A0A7D4AQW2_ACTVE|nr:hypothetical protein [Actinomadura verrucosospora]QKG24448.1 hypothetical protein ACTIVE_6095 [Actinomadura verrucosospora]
MRRRHRGRRRRGRGRHAGAPHAGRAPAWLNRLAKAVWLADAALAVAALLTAMLLR